MLASIHNPKNKTAPSLSRKNQVKAQNTKGNAMKNMLGNLFIGAKWPYLLYGFVYRTRFVY